MSEPLTNVILSNPSYLDSAEFQNGRANGSKRSWIQLAKTGSFTSNRYGKFSITKDDLSQMLQNFTNITPKSPTELPIDYDHLSMDPKKPGDGIAAGWMKKLELRGNGEELWAEVEWTPDGAERIANQEYRFVSPSFVKDHVHKDGKKIGTCLLAAAVTNHPFLEGMRALTLYNFSAHGDLALREALAKPLIKKPKQRTISLAEIGQRVMIAPGNARTQDEIGGTFEIAEVIGEGDDAFVSVKDAGGLLHKWFRMTELLPASTVPANPAHPALQPGQSPVIPAQMPGVPVQPVTQAMNPAQAAAAQAAQVAGAAAGVPGAVPGAPGAAGAVPPAGAAPNPFAKKGEPGDKVAATKENEGATAAEKPKAEAEEPTPEDLDEMLKKAMAMLAGGVPQQKGLTNMMFTLRNDKNEEIKVSDVQLEAAGIKIVPEGSTAIPVSELAEMKGTITNLSSTVDVLKADVELKAKEARTLELRSLLGSKLKGGFISKATHDKFYEQFKDAVDLSSLREIVATFTTPVIALNKEHGTGAESHDEQGDQAGEKILALSSQIAKERGISLSDAVKLAGAQLSRDADAYREYYANTSA